MQKEIFGLHSYVLEAKLFPNYIPNFSSSHVSFFVDFLSKKQQGGQ